MMNKMKSAGVHAVKFLFILPLVAVLLLAFRNSYRANQSNDQQTFSPLLKPGFKHVVYTDTIPPIPPTRPVNAELIPTIAVPADPTIPPTPPAAPTPHVECIHTTVACCSNSETPKPCLTHSQADVHMANAKLISHGSGQTVIAPMAASSGNGVTIVDDFGYTITGKEDIILTITKNTTREELEKFKLQMKEKGIDLTYDEIEYNEKGKLVVLTGHIKSNDGTSNFVATDFEKLVLAMIKKGTKTYFKVSTKNRDVI